MGQRNEVEETFNQRWSVAYRPPQLYLTTGSPYTLFTINVGPVKLIHLFARAVSGAPAAGTTFDVTVCGVAADAGAVNVNGAVNTLMMVPLNVASALTPNALAMPVLVTAVASDGMLASVGNIQLVVAAASTIVTIEWFCCYYRVHPQASVSVA